MSAAVPSRRDATLDAHAQLLADHGPETAAATPALVAVADELHAQHGVVGEALQLLARELGTWPDHEGAAVVAAVADHLRADRALDPSDLLRWLRHHPAEAEKVADCLSVAPPDRITVIRLLSRAGSQKVVYLANWHTAQREVVLKRFIGEGAAERLIPRELRPHPLSMVHPNIIETHLLTNRDGEQFLVERRLSAVLNDDWSSRGVNEAANLLHDIASALQFLHDRGLVHGDVKPDNIGYEDRRYILLDFGICRPASDFNDERSATGSLRTRSPELLCTEAGHSAASDVWALGATVFNATCGRFPLFDVGERPPRISHPAEREVYEEALARRVRDEWDDRVSAGLEQLVEHQPLRAIICDMLAREPQNRPSAGDVAKRCRSELAAYVRSGERTDGFSSAERVQQLLADLAPPDLLEVMPQRKKTQLAAIVGELQNAPGLANDDKARLAQLYTHVSGASGS